MIERANTNAEPALRELPESETYEDSLQYWPYDLSLKTVIERVVKEAPQGGTVLDVMCGPGYLLGKLKEQRPDLSLTGVDIDARYIPYGQQKYPGINFQSGDALTWRPAEPADIVVCTGSVHHIPYEQQEAAIANIATMVKPGGVVIISDCYVDDYSNETERKAAAAKLGYEYLRVAIERNAPDKVIAWTADILWNDVFGKEFKPSLEKRLPLLERHFAKVETIHTWPGTGKGYGDYIHICTPK